MADLIRQILTARVYDAATETPLDAMPRLSERLGRPVSIKREDLQPVFSFKVRGAYNRMVQLSEDARQAGVIGASAGNHAQGLALAASRLGIRATVVVPTTTPAIKVNAIRRLGAEVIMHGEDFDAAHARARELERETGATFVHPFDDEAVIAGQGTIGTELLRQHPGELEAVFLPIGGGGLAAGVATIVRYLRPGVKIIGVEPDDAASMRAAFEAGGPVTLKEVGLFADGVAVKRVSDLTFRLCREHLDGLMTVDTDAICAAIKDVYENCRAIPEPSGAVALAGLKAYAAEHGPGSGGLAAVVSGANLNFDQLRYVAERAELGEGLEALLAVGMPERPGSYRQFIRLLNDRSLTAFSYRYADPHEAKILVGVRLKEGRSDKDALISRLEEGGFQVTDLSDNETVKNHTRYLVGGRARLVENELIFSFVFPERPGALPRFLESLHPDWNITLFHYRYHGADYGRVLAGIEAPDETRAELWQALDSLGYPYEDVTEDESTLMFLKDS